MNITIRQRKKISLQFFACINDNTFISKLVASVMPKLSRVFAWHDNILQYYLILMEFNLRTTFNQFSQNTHT